ncbi:LPXTG cell wall anchor domain-containing protein [Conexibacter woesei]|uniref:Uncharacterized protein n=1 Tax=Conexibacter woesei (strain DSM 14684 / CCUG 47730 / CIP 108061 / JCM 11494 / NBRC 100937 / ID131577) TaxID=469383 RepID=D3FBT3_CONWI|nr:LPXTG cell wall anchor domain-containing protein [Conexibacter woesei]ADB51348.1 conserved hypothetical protein [Conexibacter woesei DSM 14684]
MSEREPHHFPEDPDTPAEPHDVLAAEEFPGPSRAEAIHEQGPIELPADPSGVTEPHDVLAAEEFAMPAPRHGAPAGVEPAAPSAGSSRAPLLVGLLAAAVGLLVVLRKRRRAAR